jgi:spore coat protein U-like protein
LQLFASWLGINKFNYSWSFRMKISRVLVSAAALALSVSSLGVSTAATVSSVLNVSTNVLGTCSFSAPTYNMVFADYAPVLNAPSQSLTVAVTCSNTVPYSLGVTGLAAGKRQMTDASSNNLEFNIFQDAAFTTVLGNTPGTDTFAAVGTGLAQSYTLYGKIPDNTINRGAPAGAYQATLAIDIIY